MHYVWVAIVGLVVGAIARFVLPGEQKMGIILTSLLGIAGSLIAGFVGQSMGWYAADQPAGWIASVVGAVVLLFIVQKLRGGGSSGSSGTA
ncbi:MAG: GlsB/YeaQ/YmgE family stress response membrane protein [Rubrivivax sp.]|nr:GlsB/YeaQ/YmgE family stress response membrane protein [Rubrivivax sp.]